MDNRKYNTTFSYYKITGLCYFRLCPKCPGSVLFTHVLTYLSVLVMLEQEIVAEWNGEWKGRDCTKPGWTELIAYDDAAVVLQCARWWRQPLIPIAAVNERTALHRQVVSCRLKPRWRGMMNQMHHRCRCWRSVDADAKGLEGRQLGESFHDGTEDNAVTGHTCQLLLQQWHATLQRRATTIAQVDKRRSVCNQECSEWWAT